jgi:glutamate-1-semialdehyde aminotransferase
MEPFRYTEPEAGFLDGVREICDKSGAVLVFDEITTGWRFGLGGIHCQLGVDPDVVVYAKAIGNGHPMGAIVGRRRVMDAAQSSFVSSTYWTEAVGPCAAIATVRKLQRVDVPAHVERIGSLFRDGVARLGREHGVPVRLTGRGALMHLTFEHSETEVLTTLLTVRMLERGFLAGSGFYPSLAHEDRHVEAYIAAADRVFGELSQAIRAGDVRERLQGSVRHSGFARLT